jgi:hypothetical protein
MILPSALRRRARNDRRQKKFPNQFKATLAALRLMPGRGAVHHCHRRLIIAARKPNSHAGGQFQHLDYQC